jgi:hypothetical protein
MHEDYSLPEGRSRQSKRRDEQNTTSVVAGTSIATV